VRGPILVFGATGVHGGAVARALLEADYPVAAFVRDPRSERALALADDGARLIVGDLSDGASISRALEQMDVAYAVTTPFEDGAEGEVRQGTQILASATQTRLPWLMLASVASAAHADVPHFQSKARIEQLLRQSALTWTVVAPTYFYENVLGARREIRDGRLPLALPSQTPLQQVALQDLGALVVAILSRAEEHAGERVEVAGDSPTPEQMAQALGVRHHEVSVAEVAERNPDVAAMYSFLAQEGYAVDIDALERRYPEVAWRSFAEWAANIDWRGDQSRAD
jgi:uncharacterized protein YbjT (DUF2867 family)